MRVTEIASSSGSVPVYPTVVHMFAHSARQAPDALALVFGEHRLTYSHYQSCVAQLARKLIDLGAAQERVATVLPNGINTCVATYGILAARAQCIPLNPLYTERELTEILSDAVPRVLIVDERYSATLSPVAQRAGIQHLIVVNEGERSLRVAATVELALPEPLPAAGDMAMLQYTGGTTGRAKGVNLLHYATSINVSQREGLLPTRPDSERIYCVMPLFHAYALAMGLHLACWCRGVLVIHERFSPEAVLQTIEDERITIFPGSPTLFNGVMAHERFPRTDFSSIHTCYSGAAPLPQDSLKRWQEAVNAPVYEGYGQTEAGPIVSFNPAQGECKLSSVGVAVADTQMQIVDTQTGTQVLGTGEIGEIRVRGPQLMHSYRGLDAQTQRALRDGWLYTGDIGELDSDGYLFIRERLKDMVLVGGYNVYPREIDDVLFMHPQIQDAAAVGAPDDYRGEVIRAFVVLREESDHDQSNAAGAKSSTERAIESIQQHCRQNLAPYKCPVSIDVVDNMPKTSVSKTDKTVLRRWAHERYGAA